MQPFVKGMAKAVPFVERISGFMEGSRNDTKAVTWRFVNVQEYRASRTLVCSKISFHLDVTEDLNESLYQFGRMASDAERNAFVVKRLSVMADMDDAMFVTCCGEVMKQICLLIEAESIVVREQAIVVLRRISKQTTQRAKEQSDVLSGKLQSDIDSCSLKQFFPSLRKCEVIARLSILCNL